MIIFAGGNMSMGNIRMSNINMNKYDAAQSMNVGTKASMSMDMQNSATMENSIKAGHQQLDYNKVSQEKTGTVMWRDEKTGDLYRAMGHMEQTSGGFNIDGMIQNLSTGRTVEGSVSGLTKDMNPLSNGQQNYKDAVNHFDMNNKEIAELGGAKGENITFMDSMSHINFKGTSGSELHDKDVDSTLKERSNKDINENIVSDKNVTEKIISDKKLVEQIDSNKNIFERITDTTVTDTTTLTGKNISINGQDGYSGTITEKGGVAIFEGTNKDGLKYSAILGGADISFGKNGVSMTGKVARSVTEGGSSTDINNTYSEKEGLKLALGDEITGHGGAKGVLKKGYSKYIGSSIDDKIAQDAFLNSITQNQNAILSQSGSNMTSGELATSLRAHIGANGQVGISIPGVAGTGISMGIEAAAQAALKQTGSNATSADFNRIMNEEILKNVGQQLVYGNIKAEDYDKVLEQSYNAYEKVLKDIARGTGEFNPMDVNVSDMVNTPKGHK